MEILRDMWDWVIAVLEHWHGWVSGSLLAFFFELGDKIWEWKPSKKLLFTFVLLGLLWSIFSAWRDEHRLRLSAETQKAIPVSKFMSLP